MVVETSRNSSTTTIISTEPFYLVNNVLLKLIRKTPSIPNITTLFTVIMNISFHVGTEQNKTPRTKKPALRANQLLLHHHHLTYI